MTTIYISKTRIKSQTGNKPIIKLDIGKNKNQKLANKYQMKQNLESRNQQINTRSYEIVIRIQKVEARSQTLETGNTRSYIN